MYMYINQIGLTSISWSNFASNYPLRLGASPAPTHPPTQEMLIRQFSNLTQVRHIVRKGALRILNLTLTHLFCVFSTAFAEYHSTKCGTVLNKQNKTKGEEKKEKKALIVCAPFVGTFIR